MFSAHALLLTLISELYQAQSREGGRGREGRDIRNEALEPNQLLTN